MKAIVYEKYGSADVLELKEIEKPTPKDNEVLVKVRAVSINAADRIMLSGKPFMVRLMIGGLLKPKTTILGGDISGQVEAVGKNVEQFQPGDEVFGDILGSGQGSLAEYVSVPEKLLALKPANLSFEEASTIPIAGFTALQALRNKGQVNAGQKVLIYGASGGVGVYLVQVAKSFGAEVTAVCSTRNLEMVRSIGADHVIDYTQEDFAKNEQRYDWIIAANGYHPISVYKRALKPGGIYVCTGGTMPQIFQSILLGPLMSKAGGKQISNLAAKADQEDLLFLKELFEAGKVKPIIDKCYPLHETAKAFHYLEEQHAQGKVVIIV